MNIRNLEQFCRAIIANGGASYRWNGMPMPESGYIVALRGSEDVSEYQEGDLQGVKDKVAEYLTDTGILEALEGNDYYLGGWLNEGKLYLGISDHWENLRGALVAGTMRGQIAIYDIDKDEDIECPYGQTHGTETQKLTFARKQVDDMLHV